MTNDNDLVRKYADVLPYHTGAESDPDLHRLIADLDHMYNGETLPPELEARIAAARSSTATARPEDLRQGSNYGGKGMKLPRRISVIAASVAAGVVVVLISLLLYGAHSGANVPSFQQRFAQLGGIQVVLAEPAGTPTSDSLPADMHTIEQRLVTAAAISPSNILIYADNANHLVVDIAGVQVVDQQIMSLLTTTGQFDVIDTGSTPFNTNTNLSGQTCTTSCKLGQFKIVFTGSELDPSSIQASIDPASNEPVVLFEFRPAFRGAFATYTLNNVGNYFTVTVDNKVIESATIDSEITGLAEISVDGMTSADAANLAAEIKYGALRVPLKIIHQTTVQPGTPLPIRSSTPTGIPLPIGSSTPAGTSLPAASPT